MVVTHSVVINRPVEDVFAAATSLPLSVVWRSAVACSVQTSDGPVGVGATFDQEVRVMGMSRTNTAVITEYDPPRCFAYEHVRGLAHYFARFSFEPEGEATRFTITTEGEALPAWLKLMRESLMVRWAHNTVAQEMETLKELLESGVNLETALATS